MSCYGRTVLFSTVKATHRELQQRGSGHYPLNLPNKVWARVLRPHQQHGIANIRAQVLIWINVKLVTYSCHTEPHPYCILALTNQTVWRIFHAHRNTFNASLIAAPGLITHFNKQFHFYMLWVELSAGFTLR